MGPLLWILLVLVGIAGGIGTGFWITRNWLTKTIRLEIEREISQSSLSAEEILSTAKKEAKDLLKAAHLDAKEKAQKIYEENQRELNRQRDENKRLETRIEKREENLSAREEQFSKREDRLREKEAQVHAKEGEVDKLVVEQQEKLFEIGRLTETQAKEQIFGDMERKYRHDLAQMFKTLKDQYEEDAEQHARWTVSIAIQRHASEIVNEATVNTVSLPSDDMKGRIIGREGRNIRAFEKITGTDLIIDDTPEIVVVSCFNPLRREIARRSLEKLVLDGRIHPTNIEEMYEKSKGEVYRIIKEEGQNALFETGIKGLHGELVKLLGRLKFRTSFGQNVLEHSIEVASFAGMMAAELGLNAERAKRGALLHDIGKAVDHEVEGSHALIGAELAKRYGEKDDVINMIQHHHNEVDPLTPEAVLVAAADALSAARPGARRETVDLYLKRLELLENIANAYEMVEKSFAIQAGRELRIIVQPEKVDDALAEKMAFDIAREIEEKVQYPGQLKVTVIREKRATAYAN
ncbi:MAG TPA: ribonuclease Y [Thermotogota bacterium]|nr:ribonuclease Y [Thermotogota bacterium]HRW91430.1 ribonuclease Y [Thermotogota bacterium]